MLVGSSCFESLDMKSYCEASSRVGVCEITGKECEVVDFDDFDEFFSELFLAFECSDKGEPLYLIIHNNWTIFSDSVIAKTLLNDVAVRNGFKKGSEEKVVYSERVFEYVPSWKMLKERVCFFSRFFAHQSSEDQELWSECFQPNVVVPAETIFYRGRLNQSEVSTFTDPEDLKAPPAKFASSGRANSHGIPVLYLSTDKNTLMYETRALYGDKLSIGEFHTVKELALVDFNYVPDLYREYSRSGADTLLKAMRFHFLMQAISKDMSKPMRRYDVKELEYVPTQYVCEFIRENSDADGIMFSSSLHVGGINVVLFDVAAAVCHSVEVAVVGQLHMKYEEV